MYFKDLFSNSLDFIILLSRPTQIQISYNTLPIAHEPSNDYMWKDFFLPLLYPFLPLSPSINFPLLFSLPFHLTISSKFLSRFLPPLLHMTTVSFSLFFQAYFLVSLSLIYLVFLSLSILIRFPSPNRGNAIPYPRNDAFDFPLAWLRLSVIYIRMFQYSFYYWKKQISRRRNFVSYSSVQFL